MSDLTFTESPYFIVISIVAAAVLLILLLNYFINKIIRSKYQQVNPVEAGKAKLYIKLAVFILVFSIVYTGLFNYLKIGVLEGVLEDFKLINNNLLTVSLFSILRSVLRLFFFYFLFTSFKYIVSLHFTKKGNEDAAGSLKSLIANISLLIIVVIFLSDLGINWKLLVPVAGALGLGIGIGLQNIMNNYLSGFILLFTRKLKIGDIVEVEGNAGRAIGYSLQTIYGRVVNIDAFNTVIVTLDSIEIVVPNSSFISGQVVNYSLSDANIRVRIPFGVSYSSDPNTVKEILLKVATENSSILLLPAPDVWFSEYADSSLIFTLLCWINIKNVWKVNALVSDIYFKAWYELKEAGVEIPFPQQDIWFKNKLKVEVDK